MNRPVKLLDQRAQRDVWLKARLAGIGASEIAAVAGLGRWRSRWDVWQDKLSPRDDEMGRDQEWGLYIEQQIISFWAERAGVNVIEGGLYRHPDHEWLISTPDALTVAADDPGLSDPWVDYEPDGVVDAKNAGWRLAHEWDDEGAPIEYICQITWQMLTMQVRRGYLVAVIGGKPPAARQFDLDDDLGALLIARGAEFWPYVQQEIPPPLDGSHHAAEWVKARYADADPDAIAQLTEADLDQIREWITLDDRIGDLKRAKEAVETGLKDRLATAQFGRFDGRDHVTWKTVERAGYTVRPGTYRKFHVPKAIREELTDGNR